MSRSSQLDPIAASDFISTLQKLNREFGLTILLVEHRLEEVFQIADRALLMDGGRILFDGTPKALGNALPAQHPMQAALPSAVRIFRSLGIPDDCPLTVREGRDFLERHFSDRSGKLPETEYLHSETVVLELKNVWSVTKGTCRTFCAVRCYGYINVKSMRCSAETGAGKPPC